MGYNQYSNNQILNTITKIQLTEGFLVIMIIYFSAKCMIHTGMQWKTFHPLDTLNKYLYCLRLNYPEKIDMEKIGQSYEGRPIFLAKISTNRNGTSSDSKNFEKALLIDAGIHAREWISISSAIFILKELVENNFKVKTDYTTVYVVPMLNPDG